MQKSWGSGLNPAAQSKAMEQTHDNNNKTNENIKMKEETHDNKKLIERSGRA